jgi:chromate transport protein ChrA
MTTPQDPYGRPNTPPAAPPLNEGELRGAQTLPAPQPVQVSFWLWVATAVIGLVAAVVTFTQRDAAVNALRAANTQHLSDEQLQAAATIGLVFAAVLSIVFAGLYVLFAVKARAGRNWARITLAIVTVLRVILLATSFTVLGALSTLVAVVAAVLLFLPASNQFYAAAKRPAAR